MLELYSEGGEVWNIWQEDESVFKLDRSRQSTCYFPTEAEVWR